MDSKQSLTAYLDDFSDLVKPEKKLFRNWLKLLIYCKQSKRMVKRRLFSEMVVVPP
jgi:hypothetical protein